MQRDTLSPHTTRSRWPQHKSNHINMFIWIQGISLLSQWFLSSLASTPLLSWTGTAYLFWAQLFCVIFVSQSLVFCIVRCRSLSVSSVLFLLAILLSFLELQPLITSLVSSNFSWTQYKTQMFTTDVCKYLKINQSNSFFHIELLSFIFTSKS